MTGFTKLFSSLVHSTVWREDMHVKVVWITMLALADRNGVVGVSLPGLADCARVTIEQCEDALTRLASPDKHSRTKLYEGRRIEEVDGGWRILNYLKYREIREADERRIQTREAVARHRAKKAESLTVSDVSHESRSKPKQKQKQKQRQKQKDQETPAARGVDNSADAFSLAPYLDAYQERFPGSAVPAARFGKTLKALEAKHGADETLRRWMVFLQEKGELGPEFFARTWSEWSSEASTAEQAWDAMVAILPSWRQALWSAEDHALLDAGSKAGISKIGGFQAIAGADEIGRKSLRKQFIAAYRAASNGGK